MTKHKKRNVDFVNHNLHKDAMCSINEDQTHSSGLWSPKNLFTGKFCDISSKNNEDNIKNDWWKTIIYKPQKFCLQSTDDLKYQELVSRQENGIK